MPATCAENHDCPQVHASAPRVIDGPVWERVAEVLQKLSVMIAEVEPGDRMAMFEHDLAALDEAHR